MAMMQILETGIRNSNRQQELQREQGFSLVEILVVVLIVAIVTSAAMLSFANVSDDRELRTEARRFAALVEVALDEATMQGRDFGIELMTGGYRFVEYDAYAARWTSLPGDDTLRLRALPDSVEIELFMEGQRVLLSDSPAAFDVPDDTSFRSAGEFYAPHLLVYSSGDATPFEMHLWRASDDRRVIVRGDGLGTVKIADDED